MHAWGRGEGIPARTTLRIVANEDNTGPIYVMDGDNHLRTCDTHSFDDDMRTAKAFVAAETWLRSKGESVVIHPNARDIVVDHLVDTFRFAQSIGKEDSLVRALDQAVFPTFFGKPAYTLLTKDFAPHSFYFMVYLSLSEALGGSGWVMNGGVIFHASWKNGERDESDGDWSLHS